MIVCTTATTQLEATAAIAMSSLWLIRTTLKPAYVSLIFFKFSFCHNDCTETKSPKYDVLTPLVNDVSP